MCAGAARPSITSAMAAAASSLVRSSWRVSFSMRPANMTGPSVRLSVEEVAKDPMSFARQNGLGMELHAVHRQMTMTQPHDCAVFFRPRSHLEVRRKPIVRDDERVVTGCLERSGDAGEHAAAVVLNRRGLAMHRHVRPHDLAS